MAIDYSLYPKNWKTVIRPDILKRANNCCEKCGIANHSYIFRSDVNGADYLLFDPVTDQLTYPDGQPIRMSETPDEYPIYEPPSYVRLTIAHLDQDITHNDYSNLAALCERCHLGHDMPVNIRTRRRNRIRRSGQLALIPEEEP